MGRIYGAISSQTAVTTAVDIVEILAPSDAAVRIHHFNVYQVTDFGDAEEEIISIILYRNPTVSGSGGAAGQIRNMMTGDSATGITTEEFNTTLATGGFMVSLFGWNVRVPLEVWYPPEIAPVIAPGERWCIRMGAPADSLTVNYCVILEEIGG